MRFFRQHRSSLWLAIFALAVQLTLSFGHIHAHAAKHGLTSPPGTSALTVKSPCPTQNGDDDAHCAICWSINIVGAAVVPPPILIGPPLRVANPLAPPLSTATLRGRERIHSRARAPPFA
jgi:hypothetical protein